MLINKVKCNFNNPLNFKIFSSYIFPIPNKYSYLINKKIVKIKSFNYSKQATQEKHDKNQPIDIKNVTKKELEELRNKKISDKLDNIFKKEIDTNEKNKNDKIFVLKKIEKIHKILGYMKIPLLIAIYPLAFSNPFSFNYSVILYSVNNYMILLTLLESSLFNAAGVLNYLLNLDALIPIREKKSIRRLTQSFLFFSTLLYAAKLSNDYMNMQSLILLLASNIFLYVKISYHVHEKLFTKDYIYERMVYLGYNIFLCLALMIIVYWKKNIYSQLI